MEKIAASVFFLNEKIKILLSSSIAFWKTKKKTKTEKSECLLRHGVIPVLCCSGCWFTGPFCHGALKLDISTLFTTFFLWMSVQFILFKLFMKGNERCHTTEAHSAYTEVYFFNVINIHFFYNKNPQITLLVTSMLKLYRTERKSSPVNFFSLSIHIDGILLP